MEEKTQETFEDLYSSVTMNEFVESKKAKKLFNAELAHTSWYVGVPIIVMLIGIVIAFIAFIFMQSEFFMTLLLVGVGILLVGAISWKIGHAKREAAVGPYRELYKRARKNDEIRFDEKIRFLERKRLEQEHFENKNTKENIKKTLKGPGKLEKK